MATKRTKEAGSRAFPNGSPIGPESTVRYINIDEEILENIKSIRIWHIEQPIGPESTVQKAIMSEM